jgi:hypothetical protein
VDNERNMDVKHRQYAENLLVSVRDAFITSCILELRESEGAPVTWEVSLPRDLYPVLEVLDLAPQMEEDGKDHAAAVEHILENIENTLRDSLHEILDNDAAALEILSEAVNTSEVDLKNREQILMTLSVTIKL